MKPASLFLLHLILLACFNWFGSLSSSSDSSEISGDDNGCLLLSSDGYSNNNVVILEKALPKIFDFIAPSKQENRNRIIRKPFFCAHLQLCLLHLFFQLHPPAVDLHLAVAAARLPAFPLRI